MTEILTPGTPVPSTSAEVPASVARRKARNPLAIVLGLSALFFLIFLVLSSMFFFKGRKSGTAAVGGTLFGSGSIGVVELNGVIMDSKKTLKRLENFEDDAEIKGVVLRINSPGGAVAPSQEVYEAVKHYKKPLVVSMSSVAASGGFYIACGAKKVYANPGTITGSIGVIMEFLNLEKLYEWARVKRYSIKTGRYKDAGAEYRDMEPDERALLQGMVDDVLLQFKQAVSDGRKLSMDQVTAVADGRIFSGAQAKKAHLVDELGTFQDAVNDVAKQAKITGKPTLVYSSGSKRNKILDFIMDDNRSDESSESNTTSLGWLASLVSMLKGSPVAANDVSPGVYWLWTGAR